MNRQAQFDHFSERGWLVLDIPDAGVVTAVGEHLLRRLRATALPDLEQLEEYHHLVTDDRRHVEVLFDLARFYWAEKLGTTLIESLVPFFGELIGPDLHVQKYPYLRAVRPGADGDAVRLHRDTYYGSSPYEIAVFIPFVDMPAESALHFVPGSHAEPDEHYPWTRGDGGGVTSGSPRHQLGFPYAPKLLDPALLERAEAVPLRRGQAVLFNLALVHGAGINRGRQTRFSTDIRVVNSFAPIEWSHSVHPDYYLPLRSSVVTRQARRYLDANAAAGKRD